MDATTGELMAVQPASASMPQPAISRAIANTAPRLRWSRLRCRTCRGGRLPRIRWLWGCRLLRLLHAWRRFAQVLHHPFHAALCPRALRIDLQRFADVLQALPWPCDGRQDQPCIFEVGCEFGGALRPLTRLPAVPVAECHAGFVDRAAGFLETRFLQGRVLRRRHGVTVGTGVGTTFSLLMKHIRPLTMPSATWSECLVSKSRSRLRNPVSMMPAMVFGSISEKA